MNYLTNYYKNLSEQLQEKVNHLQRLVETANLTPDNFDGSDANITGDTREVVAGQQANEVALETHGKIRDAIINLHAEKYPHMLRMGDESATSRSAAHIADLLDTHPSAPFTSAEAAVKAIAPKAIEGNYELERRIYEKRPEIGGDISEHPHYEHFVVQNEEDYTDDLIGAIQQHLRRNRK
jgi:hypothetical protein